jgi:hypothetical protein
VPLNERNSISAILPQLKIREMVSKDEEKIYGSALRSKTTKSTLDIMMVSILNDSTRIEQQTKLGQPSLRSYNSNSLLSNSVFRDPYEVESTIM